MKSRALPGSWLWLALTLVACAEAPGAVTQGAPSVVAPVTGRYVVPPPALPLGSLQLSGDVAALHARKPVKYLVRADDLPQLARDLAAVHPEAEPRDGGVLIGHGSLPDAIEPRHREPSFLVDAEQPEIATLVSELDGKQDAESLRKLVQTHLPTRLYGQFWTASRAARTGAGDCSEHAVLTAAVARRLGIPARVVVGYVLLGDERSGAAVGHAWTELHDGTRWVEVDATPLGDDRRAYVVAAELTDEGPSFTMALFRALGMLRATAIEVVAAP